MASGGKDWDTVKPLYKWFKHLHRVLLMDDDAYKAGCTAPCFLPNTAVDACNGLQADECVTCLLSYCDSAASECIKAF